MSSIYTRNHYDAPKPVRPMTAQGPPTQAFLHHSDDIAQAVDLYNTKAEQVAKVRAIDQFHKNGRGWSMIGYHWVVFQKVGSRNEARAFQARPALYVPAAQQDHNTRTLAICVVGDGNVTTIYQDTADAIVRILNMYKRLERLGGHRDVVATSCPGDKFYAARRTIARRAGLKVY